MPLHNNHSMVALGFKNKCHRIKSLGFFRTKKTEKKNNGFLEIKPYVPVLNINSTLNHFFNKRLVTVFNPFDFSPHLIHKSFAVSILFLKASVLNLKFEG